MTFFGLGPNELWLSIHGLLFILILGFTSYLFGAVYFSKLANEIFVKRLKVSAAVTFLLTIALLITGIIPDINFGSGSTFTATYTNDFGTFTSSVTDDTLAAFTGPLIFDMMEHVTLIGAGLGAVVTFLIWHFGPQAITDRSVRRSILALMMVSVAWILVLGVIGTVITKTLTFPPGA